MSKRKHDETAPAKKQANQTYLPEYHDRWKPLGPSKMGQHYVHCSLCNADFSCKHGGAYDCKRHVQSSTHERNKKCSESSSIERFCGVNFHSIELERHRSITKAELKMCGLIAKHNLSLSTADSLIVIVCRRNSKVVPPNHAKLKLLKTDHLYHISLDTETTDLRAVFGDVKFVCFGGQMSRMEQFSSLVAKELCIEDHEVDGDRPLNYAKGTDRYSLHKVGPVLSVSHGIGMPSLSVVFNEIVKLVHYAGCTDVQFFRIGTSGGIGLEPGTVVITDRVLNGQLEPFYKMSVLGEERHHPAIVDTHIVEDILACSYGDDDFKTVRGTTLCTDDFYEGQARLDGAYCDYEEKDKMEFLHKIKQEGVCNIEMESLGFLANSHRAGIKGAVVCVTLLDRLEGDFISCDIAKLKKWQERPQNIAIRYIKKKLNLINGIN